MVEAMMQQHSSQPEWQLYTATTDVAMSISLPSDDSLSSKGSHKTSQLYTVVEVAGHLHCFTCKLQCIQAMYQYMKLYINELSTHTVH